MSSTATRRDEVAVRRTSGRRRSAVWVLVLGAAAAVWWAADGARPGQTPATESAANGADGQQVASPSDRGGPSGEPVVESRPDSATQDVADPASPARVVVTVVGVVDGDTIDLADGRRVRIAITDTPEVHGGAEPCGPEASAFTADLVLRTAVTLRRPTDAPTTDGSGRTLAEVVTTDGTSLNVALVAAGLGTVDERFVDEDPDLAERLRSAAATAVVLACRGTQPAIRNPGPGASAAPVQPLVPVAPSDDACHPAYVECLPIVDDLDCGDIGGPVRLTGDADPYRLDDSTTTRRGNGIGCE